MREKEARSLGNLRLIGNASVPDVSKLPHQDERGAS